ncbi:MAG: DUF6247 family protein [Sciscionella sp.]
MSLGHEAVEGGGDELGLQRRISSGWPLARGHASAGKLVPGSVPVPVRATIVLGMSAPHAAGPSSRRHPPAPGASPAVIRAGLLPEDRAAFDTAYAVALDEARASLELSALLDTVESWRRVAALQADPDNFARIARRTAELRTGEPVPADEPLSVTRAKAGL